MDLSAEEKDNHETVKKTLTSKLTPASLLLQAMPDLDTTTRDQLLLHQFVAGLPQAVSPQLRATGEAKPGSYDG